MYVNVYVYLSACVCVSEHLGMPPMYISAHMFVCLCVRAYAFECAHAAVCARMRVVDVFVFMTHIFHLTQVKTSQTFRCQPMFVFKSLYTAFAFEIRTASYLHPRSYGGDLTIT